MRPGRVGWFVVSFVATAGIVAVATGALHDDSGTSEATTTTRPGATSSTSTSAFPAPDTDPLPVADLDAYCATALGAGATAVPSAGEPAAWSCDTGDGAEPTPISIGSACEAQNGIGSRAVLADPTAGRWICTPLDRVVVGTADPQAACGSEGGIAFLIADDRDGWRCGTLGNGVFGIDWEFGDSLRAELDRSCRIVFGDNTFAESVGTAATDWRCYAPVSE